MVSALNNEKTRLIGMKPVDAMKQTLVEQGFSQPTKAYEEKLLDIGTKNHPQGNINDDNRH